MNAETPTLSLVECRQFLEFWMEVTLAPHVTLVAIVPDGAAMAATFARGDDRIDRWIAVRQRAGCNLYFQPNETRPDCTGKPSKIDMVAALCRFADIDPIDEQFPYAAERDRLARLAQHLIEDPDFPPTAAIDSGNGLQPLWAIARETLSPGDITRIEGETKLIEDALGAGGTHNVDRLLRLPGTVNFPNRKKLALGRSVSRARLIHAGASVYSPAQAAALAAHLATRLDGLDLVRQKPTKEPNGPTADAHGDAIAALVEELRGAGAVNEVRDLPAPLQAGLYAALNARPQLSDRWAGMVDDLTARGQDSSRSGADFSLAAMLKAAGFNQLETGLILCAFSHGKANGDRWPNLNLRLRYVARCALRSHDRDSEPVDPVLALLAEFNGRYFVVNESGRAIIYEPTHDPILKRRYHTRITFEDFRKLYLNRRVRPSNSNVTIKAADVWLASPARRQFLGGVVFDPSGKNVRPDALNLWQGFSVQPRPGSWVRLRAHIRDVICGGNDGHFEYLLGWMARLVQYPAEQGEVAIVMRGGEGTGKGTLAKVLLHILAQHGMAISNTKHLTGNFNAHLRDAVLLFADEAFFAGDKVHVGVLKSLITEPFLTIEGKYQNAVQTPNFVHLMIASNERWVVPASLDARRFFVLEVSSAHANDHAYFGAIRQEMDNGGYEALLHDLLDQDLTFFNVRRVPVTVGLQEQRKLSLDTDNAWWMEVLHRGYVFHSKLGLETWFAEWHEDVATELLVASYVAFAKDRHERRPMRRETLGRFMTNIAGAKAAKLTNAVTGEHIVDVPNPFGGIARKAQLVTQPRKPGYSLGTLKAAREAFLRNTGLAVDWQDGDPDPAG